MKTEPLMSWRDSKNTHAHGYLLPVIRRLLNTYKLSSKNQKLFDLGCGNGSVGNFLHQDGWKITGIDASREGITQGRKAYPQLKLYKGSAYENLVKKYGKYPLCLSLEVVEHLTNPRLYAKNIFELLEDNGILILSTPYHGYIKNLVISILNKWDFHWSPLWDGGHIKFWSKKTIQLLLEQTGFVDIRFEHAGRISFLAKSMIVIARKPSRK